MDFVEWDESMSVGSDVFDGHHKIIIECLNALIPLMGKSECSAEIIEVMSRLEEFVLLHFSEEERALRLCGYPDWRAHKELHDQMNDLVFKLKSDVEHGRALEAAYLHEILYSWLMKHILGDDKKYEPYLPK
ncbi:MAG TPA: hemerythrin family protein [Rhodospirillaceae bacterium]|nr:hemerythrin family protein [Rhodospirillaceae bacterium]